MTWSNLGGFVLAVTLGAMVPGPTTALVIRRAALGGARSAVPVVLGIEAGLLAWAVAAAAGVAALVAASEAAYTVLRVAGAVVLVVLGVQAWLASRHPGGELPVDEAAVRQNWHRAALSGLLTNLVNPKVAVFMFAFYPQFIPPGADVLLTTLPLALLQVLIDGGWFLLIAVFVGMARKFFARERVRRNLERVTGTVLIALGLRLALEKV
ncbi:LysE family translocator [Amycolatopsis sp. YIM 10]|uniref:LysE family translocator n=1 Tax=Amycolatopsis sp. YIM 10 TaxID=2653857 RepID=UPI001290525A|nr:LysE family translocator [Amycolatopsis sp. YIM 10]QFU89911.1 Homoserine/homoserine lactone efflux protein [Amycolatopsis sp. YIM 10]